MRNKWMPVLWVTLTVAALLSDTSAVRIPLLALAGTGAIISLWMTTSGRSRWWALGCLGGALAVSAPPLQTGTFATWSPWLFVVLLAAAMAPRLAPALTATAALLQCPAAWIIPGAMV